MYRSMEIDLQGSPREKPNNKALDAEPPIASIVKLMLIGGGPVNAAVPTQTHAGSMATRTE